MKKKKKKKTSLFSFDVKGNFTTVKTSLKSILKDYDKNFPIINNLVIECNDIVIRTYQFIRLYILHKYHNNEEIPKIDREMVLYFIRAGGIRDKRGKKAKNKKLEKELNEFYNNEFQPCIQKEKFNLKNKSYLTPYLAQHIETGFNNNLKEHFITRIRRFMNIMKPEDDLDKKEFNKIKNLVLLNKELPKEFKQWGENIKNNYLPKKYEKIYGYDVKVYPEKYLFFTLKMNEEIEKRNNKIKDDEKLTDEEKRIQIKKLFQPIPLRNSIVPSYITLDTNVILSLFKEKGESQMNKNTSKNKNYIWNKIFKIDKKVMKIKGYEFKTIQTDGIGVSICFQKSGKKYRENKSEDSEEELYINNLSDKDLKECKNKKLVGVDPGKQNLVYIVDKNKNKLRYTTCQRRIESLRKRCSKITLREKVKHKIIEEETKLSSGNCKTIDYEKFKEYIIGKTQLNDKVKDFYEKELFRKMKWRTHIYKRKSEDNFLNNIEKTFGNDLLLCYGNWSNTKQMKYIMPTKGVGLRRIINKKFDVALIDEFKTSKLCSKCNGELENFRNIHRLLVCSKCNISDKSDGSESKNVTFINRDMNACLNILKIAEEWINTKTRPESFCRNTNLAFEKT